MPSIVPVLASSRRAVLTLVLPLAVLIAVLSGTSRCSPRHAANAERAPEARSVVSPCPGLGVCSRARARRVVRRAAHAPSREYAYRAAEGSRSANVR